MYLAVFVYGFLSSFVIASAERNRRAGAPNPRVLEYVGYALIGASMAAAAVLALAAATGMTPDATL